MRAEWKLRPFDLPRVCLFIEEISTKFAQAHFAPAEPAISPSPSRSANRFEALEPTMNTNDFRVGVFHGDKRRLEAKANPTGKQLEGW